MKKQIFVCLSMLFSFAAILGISACGSRCADPQGLNHTEKGDCTYPADQWAGKYDVTYQFSPKTGTGSGTAYSRQAELEIVKADKNQITLKNMGGCGGFFTATLFKATSTQLNTAVSSNVNCDSIAYDISGISGSVIPSTGDIVLSFDLTPANPGFTWYQCSATGTKK
ncbi:MAG: hypothetical protein K1X92_06220 [Bacteroidia bacterium]|nr:hypothetical protein [Bacteroidia bacterium]